MKSQFEIYYDTVREMIINHESNICITSYINDLRRSGDITEEMAKLLHNFIYDFYFTISEGKICKN